MSLLDPGFRRGDRTLASVLAKRVWEHKNDVVKGFTKRYRVHQQNQALTKRDLKVRYFPPGLPKSQLTVFRKPLVVYIIDSNIETLRFIDIHQQPEVNR